MAGSSHHQGWDITEEQREVYRQRSKQSSLAKAKALRGEGPSPIHPINEPKLNTEKLMPQLPSRFYSTCYAKLLAYSSKIEQNKEAVRLFVSPLEVLPFGEGAADMCGNLRATLERSGDLIGTMDMQIAA